MDIFSHTFIGTLACLLSLTKLSPVSIMLIWIMALFPDIDIFLEPLQKIKKMYFLSHRAGSHSYITGLIITGIVSLFTALLRNSSFFLFFEMWFGGFIGYSIHVSLDFFTASKMPIFYPLSKKEYRLIADRAINPILGLFSCLNLLVLIHFFYAGANYYEFMALTSFYLYIYIILFGFRAMLRITVQIRSTKGSHYIPGFLPIFYLIYENKVNEKGMTFKLTKHSIFSSKKKELLKKQILNNSKEMFFYEMAKEISREYRFFHKWDAIFPFFQEEDDLINVILILAESYSRMSSHFLSIVFNKNTKQIISKNNGFSNFKKWKKNNGFNS
ncbi:hypothetical protein LCGC14_0639210 [marine sediment metagenome]|uniref:Metal-dependent hydrolase n=1 Tax=marine sediment metagenome TaxID=412755 RepID=A0A0F9QZN9_9ZZZZ